jgi:cation diffusion facilitator CzcD-associated flavoprotein CzcO
MSAPRGRSVESAAMTNPAPAPDLDAVIVGAGFSGLYMLHKLRAQGWKARVFEAGSGVGGTWFWNRYPGARCDVESMEYSFKFDDALQQEWKWSERYSAQPEIMRYLNHVADRYDLRRDITFDTRVTEAHFDDRSARWNVKTETGERVSARFCIMATGCLSSTNTPKFAGLESFKGRVFHTGAWPHEPVDFTGRRVGIIGTGSSAIQAIPIIAEQARHLTVFQRTPNFSVPAQNGPLDPELQARIKAKYGELRYLGSQMPFGFDVQLNDKNAFDVSEAERRAEYEKRWKHGGLPFLGVFADLLYNKEANETAADFIREKIRSIVKDPKVAALLTPVDVVGCKRLCSDTGYFETFNRPNVTLVDVRSAPIAEITPTGLRTTADSYRFDDLVLATGFDAMTGSLTRIDIRGSAGKTLAESWSAGPRTYLGLTTVGFPNLFTITGPGSPSVLSNMVVSIEQHVEWITECIAYLREHGLARIEAAPDAQDAWVAHVNEVADGTLYPRCNSWYLGANVPGKPRVFMPYLGFPAYVEKCKEVAAHGYEGFRLA